MSSVPWVSIIGGVTLLGSAGVAAVPRSRPSLAKKAALGVSLVALVLALIASAQFVVGDGGFQFTESHRWIPDFGVGYRVGLDGIALVLLDLTVVLMPVVVLASWHEVEDAAAGGGRSVSSFFALLLALEAILVGVFAATDVFLFYVLFEVVLIPMYFLIGAHGGPRGSAAALKFLLYSLLGGLLMLGSVIGLYVVSAEKLGHGTFDFAALTRIAPTIDPSTQRWLFLGFFIAFAIKAPLFPFHTWLPDAGSEAPTGGSVLLVGVLDKIGTFGFLRYCLELFPQASHDLAPLVVTLGVIGVLYGALVAIGQRDLKRLVSYTSVAHFGFIALGCFALTSQSMTGAVLYMVNHGLSTGALFLVVGFLMARRRTRLIADYGGVQQVAPLLAGSMLLAGLSSLALPGLNSFVSEFLVLVGSFERYTVATIVATVGIILAALYILIAYQRTMHGPANPAVLGMRDLSTREIVVMAPLIFLIVGLGVYPKVLTDVITPAVQRTMTAANATDPLPTAAGSRPEPVAVTVPGLAALARPGPGGSASSLTLSGGSR
ncbi:MAG: proton-translocating NADH-quinone oxidoreductase, chain [Mycobacterium sp.]|nr:proton-translocating NADH-quinone oxidoreductase, chain [Mycobacterium sp.]